MPTCHNGQSLHVTELGYLFARAQAAPFPLWSSVSALANSAV